MPRNDLPATILDAYKYASSNVSALLVGGIVFFLSAFAVGLPFFLGYVTRCMREAISGNGVLPEWNGIVDMLRAGLRMVVVFLAYALAYAVIVSLIAIPLFIFQRLDMPTMALFSTAVLIVTMAVMAAVFCVIFFASWVLYATTDSIRVALTPGHIRHLIYKNTRGYTTALLASVAIIAMASVSALLIVIIPWVAFAAFAAIAFVYSKYYQATRNRRPQ